jgi:2-polyprenyl-6-methoxyphenol hydroxylase-like FAD-dependent oxidoreductase
LGIGGGISLGGATLRAFRRLGILEAFLEQGAASDGVEVCIPDGEAAAAEWVTMTTSSRNSRKILSQASVRACST